MRRFFIEQPLAAVMNITGQDARHIGKVLRLGPGDEIVVVGKNGQAGLARITGVGTTAVSVALLEEIQQRNEPPVEIWLAQGLAKGDKMEYIIQKAVEIGAAGIIPMAVDFSAVQYDDAKQGSKVTRWQKIALEAAKQCGRGVVPEVTAVHQLAAVLDRFGPDTTVIMLYEGAGGTSLKEILANCPAGKYLLLIGPEGGFSPAEANLCRERGARVATLGPRILRTETAAVTALSIVMYEKGDLG